MAWSRGFKYVDFGSRPLIWNLWLKEKGLETIESEECEGSRLGAKFSDAPLGAVLVSVVNHRHPARKIFAVVHLAVKRISARPAGNINIRYVNNVPHNMNEIRTP